MNKPNFDREMQAITSNIDKDNKPTLLLHSCCAPCSSAVLERLHEYFNITVFYYNPNISPANEFYKRLEEEKRFCKEYFNSLNIQSVEVIEGKYEPEIFYSAVKGYEDCLERGERCHICYRLRLEKTAEYAKENGFDYFCSTLTVSPLKDCQKINEIGKELSKKYDIAFLPSDFKKHEGFKRSISLSNDYQLYRQNFCGCIFSKMASEK